MNLSSWGNWINQIADDVSQQIDGGFQNVEQIVRAAVNNSVGPGLNGATSNTYFRSSQQSPQGQEKRHSPDQAGTSGNFFMGNGGLAGNCNSNSGAPFCATTSTVEDMDTRGTSLKHCDHCGAKFSFFFKKRVCSECKDFFCSNCIVTAVGQGPESKSSQKFCVSCNVLNKRPLERNDLMGLRIKDLQKHLVRKKINTKSCLEKKDLVELIIRESLGTSTNLSTSSNVSPTGLGPSEPNPGPKVTPFERQTSFPKNYVDSSHRREWFEKLDVAEGREEASDEHLDLDNFQTGQENVCDEVVPTQIVESDLPKPDEPAIPMDDVDEPSVPVTRKSSIMSDGSSNEIRTSETEDREEGEEHFVDGAVGGSEESLQTRSEPKPIPLPHDLGSLSAASSPSRRFARQGLVRLDEIESLEDLGQLSAKQCKDLLAMNRVNFHGIIEKEELMKIVERLWKQERKAQKEKDTMEDTDLCKICWDAAVDCVMLECGHMATCTNCGKQLAECPICRQYVVRVVRTFKA